jgi:hypothetical protein
VQPEQWKKDKRFGTWNVRLDYECLGFLDQRKPAKVQWLQDPSQSNVHNLTNVRSEASTHFRNKEKDYLKAKIDEIGSISDTCIRATVTSRSVTNLELI